MACSTCSTRLPCSLPGRTAIRVRSRLVFITRDLPRDVIEEGLRAFNDAAAA